MDGLTHTNQLLNILCIVYTCILCTLLFALNCIEGHNDKIIKIHHEYEGRIEKSVLRTTNWHHEACRVMTNGDPKGRIFSILPSQE